jgi:hypothetical protein
MFQKWLDDDILNLQIELSCKYFVGIFGLATFLDTFETMGKLFYTILFTLLKKLP